MPKENNKMQVDIDNLFKQNVNDLSSIKELYRKLKEVEEKITQIKYIDSNLVNKLKKEYEKLKKIILDENIQVKLTDDIETINSQMDTIVNSQGVIVERFKRLPTENDDTPRINRAIQYAKENKINRILFAPKVYNVTSGSILCDTKIEMIGFSGTDCTINNNKGVTVLNANNSTTNEPVIKYAVGKGSYVMGVKISNLTILGSDSWYDSDSTKWSDRIAIHLENIGRSYQLNDINIIGFKRGGIKGINLFDGTAFGVVITYCGTDGLYPALHLTGDDENTNAGHWFGLHIEHSPFMLQIDSGSRHNQFVACKFEVGGYESVNPKILISSNTLENIFIGCQFVNNNFVAGKSFPHMIKVKNQFTVFTGCMFSSPTSVGSLWIDGSESYGLKVIDSSFYFLSPKDYSIIIGGNSVFSNNLLYINSSDDGKKYGIKIIGNENLVIDNQFKSQSGSVKATEGDLFHCDNGTGNTFRNKIYNTSLHYKVYNIVQSANNISASFEKIGTISSNKGKPIMDVEIKTYYLKNTADNYINDFIYHKYDGEVITLIGTEGFTKIANGKTIKTKDGNHINMTAGKVVKFMYLDIGNGGQWVEV